MLPLATMTVAPSTTPAAVVGAAGASVAGGAVVVAGALSVTSLSAGADDVDSSLPPPQAARTSRVPESRMGPIRDITLSVSQILKVRCERGRISGRHREFVQRIERFENGLLTNDDAGAGSMQIQPLEPVQFGEFAYLTRLRRPLHLEGVACTRRCGDVSTHRPDVYFFAPVLTEDTEVSHRSGRNRVAGLLGELSLRGCPVVFAGLDETFRNGPGRVLSARPIRPAHVTEEDFQHIDAGRGTAAVHENPCAALHVHHGSAWQSAAMPVCAPVIVLQTVPQTVLQTVSTKTSVTR